MPMDCSGSKEYILTLLDDILKNIGQQEDIISYNDIEAIFENTSNDEERRRVDSILFKLQLINDQMENMKWLNKSYRILHDFANLCSKTLDETILLNQAYKMVSQVMPTDAFYISLYDSELDEVSFLVMIENHIIYPNETMKLSDNYTSEVIRTRRTIHLQKADPDVIGKPGATFGVNTTKSCLFVPIVVDDQVRGVISAQSFKSFAYKKEHEELIRIIGAQVINSIFTARIYATTFKRARIDEMTQLKNYRAFHEDLEKLIANNAKFSIVMIDSDNLKRINDQYGHDFGDHYLVELAKGLQAVCNKSINAYRYAGDEFMFLVNSEDTKEATHLFYRLIDYYASHPLIKIEKEIYISISTGIAHYPANGYTVEEIKKSVDNALYEAKKSGKNQVVYA